MDRQPLDRDPEGQVQAGDPLLDLPGCMRGAVVQGQVQNADLPAPEAAEEYLKEGEQPLRIWQGGSPCTVNCLYSDGSYIRCVRRQRCTIGPDVNAPAVLHQYA